MSLSEALGDTQLQLAAGRLHLGCGLVRLPGWVNADLHATPATDLTFDAQLRWPFADASLTCVFASHVLEHLVLWRPFFAEAWRCLGDGGSLLLRLPYGGSRQAWGDLTHHRPWYAESFACLQPGYGEAIGNPQHEAWPHPFWVESIDLCLEARVVRLLRWRLVRRLLLPYLDLWPEALVELHVHLHALTTPASEAQARARRPGNLVPCRYVALAQQWRGGPARRGGDEPLVVLGQGGMRA
jgi:SAM-dependent methyltransferase